MQAVRFFFHHHQCWLRSFTAQAAASSPSSRLDTTPTAVCKRMRSVLLASLRNGKHFVLLRWLFIPTQPHFVQRAFPPVLGHWLQIVVSRLLGPLAYATLRDYLEEAPLLPPETHLELVLHLQPCSFAADCGLDVHVRQDLVNGLPCQVIQSVQMSASTRPCGLVSKTLVLHLACFAYPQLRHAYMHAA